MVSLLLNGITYRKDFPGYEAYKQHMKEIHSTTIVTSTSTYTSSSIVTTTTTATTAATTATSSSISTAVPIKTEMESDARMEEHIKKEDQSDVMEDKHDPGNSDFKYARECIGFPSDYL